MVEIVTLQEAKSALRIATTDDDVMLDLLVKAASGAVVNYLKGQADAVLILDTGDDLTDPDLVPPEVKSATIMLVGILYENPDGDPEGYFEHGMLPKQVTSMLYPLRDPALA